MSPELIALIIQLLPVLIKGGVEIWNAIEPSMKSKLALAFGEQLSAVPGIVDKVKNAEQIPLDSLKLTKTAEDILKEIQGG